MSVNISVSISHDASNNCISSPGDRHGNSAQIHLILTSALKSCQSRNAIGITLRCSNLCFSIRSDCRRHDDRSSEERSLIGSGTLINWGSGGAPIKLPLFWCLTLPPQIGGSLRRSDGRKLSHDALLVAAVRRRSIPPIIRGMKMKTTPVWLGMSGTCRNTI